MFIGDKKLIGQKIKLKRKGLKMTQFELAEKIGIHEKQLSRIEAGLHYPSLENFIKIINELNISPDEFGSRKKNNPLKDEVQILLEDASDNEIRVIIDTLKSIKKNLVHKNDCNKRQK